MLEEPKIKKVDKRDKQLPQNFEQLIEMYDVEKIWPYILKIIQFINKEIPELETFLNWGTTGEKNGFGGLFGYSDDLNNTPFVITISNVDPKGYPSGLGGNSCLVITSNSNNSYRGQLAFGFGGDKLAIRRCNGSTTWTDWKYLSFS